jgi:hypothetical protein
VLVPLLGLTLLALSTVDGSGARVDYSFQLLEVRPGCSEDDLGYPVTVVIRSTATNRGERPVILSRRFAVAPYYRVSASVEQAEREQYEAQGGDLEIQSGDVPEPKFGSRPDSSQFVVVPPGGSYSTEATVAFLAAKGRALETPIPGFVLPGRHVIRSFVRPWPYLFVKTSTIERLRRRWNSIGDLVTDSAQTPFLAFELVPTMPRCDPR